MNLFWFLQKEARKKYRRAYEPWAQEEDNILKNYFNNFSFDELSDLFGRTYNSIKSRIEHLKLK